MKDILIVTTSLDIGGITSAIINLINFLSDEGHNVTLMYTEDKLGITSNKINNKVKLINLQKPSKKYVIFQSILHGFLFDLLKIKFRKSTKISPMKSIQRINYIQALYTSRNKKKYDIALSASEFFCNTYVSFNTDANKKVGWIHPEYETLKIDVDFDKKTLDVLDNIITISEPCQNSLVKVIPEYREKVLMIENLINTEDIKIKSKEQVKSFDSKFSGIKIVTVCRLDNSSKRIDRAVKACKALIDNKINVKWYLIGDGKDKVFIQSLISKMGLEKNFIMLGAKKNPYPYVASADLFVLSSQYEGKPIAVSEALILGCPIVVSNYISAKKQVDPRFGSVISNDDKLFSEELIEILKDKEKLSTWKLNLKKFNYCNKGAQFKIKQLLID